MVVALVRRVEVRAMVAMREAVRAVGRVVAAAAVVAAVVAVAAALTAALNMHRSTSVGATHRAKRATCANQSTLRP